MHESMPSGVTTHAVEGTADAWVAGHLPRIARWLHEASNPFADWYFGGADVAEAIVAEWVRRPTSELYIGRATLAWDERGWVPLGCVLGMDGETLRRCRAADFAAFCEELGGGGDADAVLAEVLPAARVLFPPVAADAFYLSRVAIAAAARGRGVGRMLVASVVGSQRARGWERFCLDVSVDNAAAIRAYGASGFRIEGTARDARSGLAYHRMCAP